MMKWVVGAGAGIFGFLSVFSFTASDEIGAAVEDDLQRDGAHQCLRRMKTIAPDPAVAEDICGCMLSEFDRHGYKIMDAFGSDRAAMQDITRGCVQDYMG